MEIIKLRSTIKIPNLDAINGKDAFLVATFTDIKVLPYSGVVRYFGEFYDYDESGEEIEGSKKDVELFNKRENIDFIFVDQLFTTSNIDFSSGSFSENLESFIKTAFKAKIAADGRYNLSLNELELAE